MPGILHSRAFVASLALLAAAGGMPRPLRAQTGYGYKKGQDPMVLSLKRIVLESRRGRWDEATAEAGKLAWLFKELKDDLQADLEKDFQGAVASRSLDRLSTEIGRLVYFAVVQKLHWNEREELKNFTRSKSRVEAALGYYEEILAIGVRNYDRLKGTTLHAGLLKGFEELRRSLGSPGLFGIQARPPDLPAFRRGRAEVENLLLEVYPQARAAPKGERDGQSSPSR